MPGPTTPPQLAQLIREQIDVLDRMLSEIDAGGVRSAEHFDELEERVTTAGRELRDAFRRGVWR